MVLDATRRTYVDLSTNLTAKSLPRVLSIIVKISIDGDKCKSRGHRYKFSGSKSYTLLNFIIPLHRLKDKGNNSGCSSARLEYTSGGRVVAGSNPVIPTKQFSKKRKPVVSLEATGFFVVVLLLDILRLKYPYWAQHYKKLCYLLQ